MAMEKYKETIADLSVDDLLQVCEDELTAKEALAGVNKTDATPKFPLVEIPEIKVCGRCLIPCATFVCRKIWCATIVNKMLQKNFAAKFKKSCVQLRTWWIKTF